MKCQICGEVSELLNIENGMVSCPACYRNRSGKDLRSRISPLVESPPMPEEFNEQKENVRKESRTK